MDRTQRQDDTVRMGRRKYIAVGTLAAVGIAGCSSNDDESANTPEEATETFYETLYAEQDIEATNEMYHPESPFGDLAAETFEPFGGLENISTVVESTEVVSEEDGAAEVHADVEYNTAEGTLNNTDYIELRQHDGEWQIYRWLAEAVREQLAIGTVEEFYAVLYAENDIEATNEMYHPESDAPELTADVFEPFGGLENITTVIESAEVVSEGGGEAEVHAEVEYHLPEETMTNTDYVFLRFGEEGWLIDEWAPEANR